LGQRGTVPARRRAAASPIIPAPSPRRGRIRAGSGLVAAIGGSSI
jgi:hypothetical protein